MQRLPVVDVNRRDGAIGVFQQNLVAYYIHHRKTAARPIAVNATDNRLLCVLP